MKKFKYPLMAMGVLSTATGLALLYQRLGLSPPLALTVTLFSAGVVFDYGTTVKASRLGGKEGNPFVNILFKKVGVEKGGLITMALFALMVIFMFRGSPAYMQLAVGCAYWLIPVNNLMVIRRLKKSKAGV